MRVGTKALLFMVLVGAAGLGALLGQAPKGGAIAYPKGYRHWTLVKTMAVVTNQHPLFEKFAGLHNVYVNDLGLPSLQQGRVYPDGTVFVFDLYDIRSAQGAIETRGRKFTAVMKKNAKLNAATGGWGFEVFEGDEQKGTLKDPQQCFSCHEKKKLVDYVHSTYTP